MIQTGDVCMQQIGFVECVARNGAWIRCDRTTCDNDISGVSLLTVIITSVQINLQRGIVLMKKFHNVPNNYLQTMYTQPTTSRMTQLD